MIHYSYEFLSLLILFLISGSILRRWRISLRSGRFFSCCILINILAALSNMAAYYTLDHIHKLPLWISYTANSLYFILIYTLIAGYTLYISSQITRFSEDRQVHRSVLILYTVLYALCIFSVLVTPFTGFVFSFDINLSYDRGPLWISGYILLTASLFLVLYFIFHSHNTRSNPYIRLVKYIIPSLYASVLFKLLFPLANIETFIGALTGLFIFIYIQNIRPESDPTTRLRNLESFIEYLRYLERKKESFQVILISLRDFGSINSTIGYPGGNEILYKAARWLSDFYEGSQLFRYGPVSFAVILSLNADDDTEKNVHRVIDSFPQSWTWKDQSYHIPAFFVDYVCTELDGDPYKVVEALDFARKEMQNAPTDHIHFNKELAEKLSARTGLVRYLRESIDARRFEVYLQPIYSAKDGCFTFAEALLRLRGADGRYISPEIFATVAEESRLDPAMNRLLIENVCAFLGSYPELPITSVSLNLTMQQLQDVGFADALTAAIRKYSVPDKRIALEVTERILLSSDTTVQLSLLKLRLSGFTLLLDDFGTGYSNFAALLRCRFDKIKLDKSLIEANDRKSLDIVSTLITLFHNNGQTVVVEGIETAEQKDSILSAGADFIQGYYYSRPLPLDEYVDFITEHNKK